MSAWIERNVSVPPNTSLNVGVTFQLLGEGISSPREVLAYLGNNDPEDYVDFTVIGQTDQGAGWCEFTYERTFVTSPTGRIYVAIGFHNHINGFRSYYFDMVNITGISADTTPPTISNFQPINETTISNSLPVIGASYEDPSGVNTTSVILKVDGVDITSSSTVTASDVGYTPLLPLSEGVHNVYLGLKDESPNQNEAIETWWFIVDTIIPVISDELPASQSVTSDSTPVIGANYSDSSGIDTSSLIIKLDSIDVTAGAVVTADGFSYLPPSSLSNGYHDVYLEVGDNSNPRNVAVKRWSFLVDTQPPAIVNLQPQEQSIVSNPTPTIGANFSDNFGIDLDSVLLKVDSTDVTSQAVITFTGITYLPSDALSEGFHSVYLSVTDNASIPSTAFWFFTLDSMPPVTDLAILSPKYIDPTGKTFVSSATLINLTSTDDSGAGVDSIWFLYYAPGEQEPSYSLYTSDFTISSSKDDGLIIIKYRSKDNAANEEPERTAEVYLDNTPPESRIKIGEPNLTAFETRYVTSLTPITFSASDGSGSGVSSTYYRVIKDGSVEIEWTEYDAGSVHLTGDDGLREIRFYTQDNVGNKEQEETFLVYLDNTPAETSIHIGPPSHNEGTTTYLTSGSPVSFSPSDGSGSGVASTWYRVLKDAQIEVDWTTYSGTIHLTGGDGVRDILFKSKDKLGNEEIEKSARIYLDNTPPEAFARGFEDSDVSYINDPLGTLEIVADDHGGSGVKSINYGADDPSCQDVYIGPLVMGTMGEGLHTIYFRSYDNLDNVGSVMNITVFLDSVAPTAEAGPDIVSTEGEIVAFDGSGSWDSPGGSGISNYTWTFIHQGNVVVLSGETQEYSFQEVGKYEVTLTIEDRAGNRGSDTLIVRVNAREEGARFTWWILAL
ncbi:MAG: PKD domain-containing protein, partial [Thermoplasmata archaeon]